MKFLNFSIPALALLIVIGVIACSRETVTQTEKAETRVLKKEETALYFNDIDPVHYPSWQLPVQKGMEYITYVKYFGDISAKAGDSASLAIYDPARDEYEIFTLGGVVDSMLGHRILGMAGEDKTISVFVPKWPGTAQCTTDKPDHRMEGDKHIVTFYQDCNRKDTAGAVIPGAQRSLQFEITVR